MLVLETSAERIEGSNPSGCTMETKETHDGNQYCACVSNHNPNVNHVHRHHIWPLGEGGPNEDWNLVWLCPTTHENVHVLLRAYKQYEGTPPWEVRKHFGSYARGLAQRGWELMQENEVA